MTNEKKEQLIRHLKYSLEIGADYLITDEDAVEIIMALEQTELNSSYNSIKTELKPCDTLRDNLAESSQDCISRQEVIDGIDRYIEKAQGFGIIDDFISFKELVVKQLPPVTPKVEWIPVTERLPEEEGYYFVTFFSDEWHSVGVCGFHKYDEGKMMWDIDNIIAWQPLPESYKESDVN